MPRILAISSFVAYGHVGLSAIVPALQALGHDVIAVPTVVLSSHYGYREVGGFDVDAGQMGGLIHGLTANGWLQSVDAVTTGFIPSGEMALGIARVLERLAQERPEVLYLCDPVIGDDPGGIYVRDEVATAIRDNLVPLADVLTPNRFELEWLTGIGVDSAIEADAAADETGAELVAVTSVPAGDGIIANLMSDSREALLYGGVLRERVPNGTGDLFAALLAGHLLDGAAHAEAVARASAGVQAVIAASLEASELRLVECLARLARAEPLQHIAVIRAAT